MPNTKRPIKVFLCHAHSDKADVKALYKRLVEDGVDAWLDKEKLLPGQDWELEIRKAVRESDVIIVCLSNEFNSAGFRQKEVRLALDTAMEKPEGEIFIIPARLEVCENLESLQKWHWVDLFEDNGYAMLMRALRLRADGIGTTLHDKRSQRSKVTSTRVKFEKPAKEDLPAATLSDEKSDQKTNIDTKVESPRIPLSDARKPFKLKTEYMIAIIGAVATIIAAVINSPLMERWFAQAAAPTGTDSVALAKVLELTSVSNPTTYNQAGQVITLTFSIKNIGTNTLGPAQFVIHDDRLGNINCGPADVTLAANQSLSCSAKYTTTEADRIASQLLFNTTASGGGASNTEPAKTILVNSPATTPSNLTPGATIRHQVVVGESLLQIARCYGAGFESIRNANPQISDPRNLSPGTIITVPNIGSVGEIYGPPCVTFYTVQSGDTWQSIATKFSADVTVLMEANQDITLVVGAKLLIPSNSTLTIPIAPSLLSTLFTVDAEVSPNQENCFGLTIPPGQVAYFKTTTSADQVAQEVHNPDDQLHKDTGDLILGGTPDAQSGGYQFCIFNRSNSPISYTLEVSLSH